MKKLLILFATIFTLQLIAQDSEIRYDGIVLPQTTMGTVTSPSIGQTIYDTSLQKVIYFDGTNWIVVQQELWEKINNDVRYTSGNVGIGTTPSDKLHINAPLGQDALRVQTNGQTKLRIFQNGGISVGSNWGNPMPNTFRVASAKTIISDTLTMFHSNGQVHLEATEQEGLKVNNSIGMEQVRISGNSGIGEAPIEIDGGYYGIEVNNSENAGIRISNSALSGLRVSNAGSYGLYVNSPSIFGLRIESSGNAGVSIESPNSDGVRVHNAFFNGFDANDMGADGLHIENAGDQGIEIDGTVNEGINVNGAGGDGIGVDGAGGDGIHVDGAGSVGVRVTNSNSTGIYVATSGGVGIVSTSNTANAGNFIGDVLVTGSLSKGSGTFKIDHPLDPTNKYLYHSFVESPDMMNIYNGNVILDANGTATVTLPEYFDALNKDFRYQLTCIGGFANVYISEKINTSQFKIAGGNEGLEVSWMVTGVRQDNFANANRVIPEVEKPGKFKGSYLHPEVFGASDKQSEHYIEFGQENEIK